MRSIMSVVLAGALILPVAVHAQAATGKDEARMRELEQEYGH